MSSNMYSEAHILVSTDLIEYTLCLYLQNECIFTHGSENNGEKSNKEKKELINHIEVSYKQVIRNKNAVIYRKFQPQ